MKLVILALFALPALAQVSRTDLLNAARTQDPNFPDGVDVQLTHFSHVCDLKTPRGEIQVVDQRAVLTGMLAPRGQNFIAFYGPGPKLLHTLRYASSRPLWCDGARLYLFGGWDAAPPGDTTCTTIGKCNVVDWTRSTPSIYHEKKYGSSGGIDDP